MKVGPQTRKARCGYSRILKLASFAKNHNARWTSTEAAASATVNYKVGDVIHGYKLEQMDYIKELNISPYYLKHEVTGAEHLHVAKPDDDNNVFAVSLRTTPKDSTGVAHILEHLALCGSKKYAVRDPFMKMTTRSLATFLNAMTGPDFTVYPFATQNQKDFENLLNVYADAVFFPRLRAVDFRQEGWRLEHEKPDKRDTPIVIRGVVYNEMKGAFSSSAAIYARQLQREMFPDTTYHHESGGDPEAIPDLTHDDLKEFHQMHYHPSNAKFFTYGNLPLENHLKMISDLVMSKFSHNPQARDASAIELQEPWKEPRVANISCPFDPMCPTPEKQSTTSVSYLLPVLTTEYEELYALKILANLLIDGPNAPFYKNLIESGLGADYSPSTGIATYTKQPYFSIGLSNIAKSDIGKVHDIIERTFREAAQKGFSRERIDVILHDIELGLKHVSGNFGLRIIMNLESTYNHDGDTIEYMRVNKYVEKFKKALDSDPNMWAKMIDKYFLNNTHKLVLNMNPQKDFKEAREKREKALLDKRVEALEEADKRTILFEGIELMKLQSTKEDVSVLPCLEPSKDIPQDLTNRVDLKFEDLNGVRLQICEQPTNEVVYFRAIANVGDKLKEANLVDYMPLFCDVATKLGAGQYNRHEFYQKTHLATSGLGLSLLINPSLFELDNFKNELLLSSHCLKRNIPQMFELWTNVLKKIRFQEDKEYLTQLIKASAADLSDGVSWRGNLYASKQAAAGLLRVSELDEKLSGLSYIARIKDIASKESIESVTDKLQRVAEIVFDRSAMRCAINAETENIKSSTDHLAKLLDLARDTTKEGSIEKAPAGEYEPTKVEDMKFPFATHYVAKSLVAVPRTHKDFAKLVIMCKLISSKYLLREVREKGGAYGAACRISNSGIINFSSYRDPNTDVTMKIFDSCAHWVTSSGEFTEQDIEESKLGVFQDVDRPVEPGRRGLSFFVSEETDDIRQEYRQRLLKVSKKGVMKVADKYLRNSESGTFII